MLYVDVLVVDQKYHKKGLGSKLLSHVEDEAKKFGATLAHLDSFDFQAKDFYLKHGYEVFGVLEDYPKGHKRYYMKKGLGTDLITLYRHAEDYFLRGVAWKCLKLADNATAYMTGVPTSSLNLVYITETPKDLHTILDKREEFFQTENLSFSVIILEKLCTPEMPVYFR